MTDQKVTVKDGGGRFINEVPYSNRSEWWERGKQIVKTAFSTTAPDGEYLLSEFGGEVVVMSSGAPVKWREYTGNKVKGQPIEKLDELESVDNAAAKYVSENYGAYMLPNALKQLFIAGHAHRQPEIDRLNERVKELENCLAELWPLSTNALGELTTDEIKQDGILSRLSDTIDKAKQLLNSQNA